MKTYDGLMMYVMTLIAFFTCSLNAKELVVVPSSGDSFIVDIEPSVPFFDVLEQLEGYLSDVDLNNDLEFSYAFGHRSVVAKKAKPTPQKGPRNYAAPVNSTEKDHIRQILTSMAKLNKIQLWSNESKLKSLGDKIDHIHPLRFLQCVFTDEELKACLFAVRNDSLVWGKYYDGLKDSLTEESNLNNLIHFAPDFANNVGVNVNDIYPMIQTRNWSGFIDYLINVIPRNPGSGRYDM